jgi:SPP1 gp7 family putative phage head morphogenesis protein
VRRAVSLHEAAHAAEELASQFLGFNVRKALDPLSPAGFLLIGERVSAKLAKAAAGAEAEVVSDVLDELDLDWATMSTAAVAAALKAVNEAIAKAYSTKLLPKLSDVLQIEGPSVMRATRLSVIASEHIEVAAKLSQRDLAAEAAIRKSHLNFIRNSGGVRAEVLSAKARAAVAWGLEQGLATDKIAANLDALFKDDIPQPESYWRVVADAFVGRARTTSQISSYEEAGIETYEIVAVLDEVTTDICRFMDGKTFSVSAARGLLDSLEALDDPEDVKYANPWVRKGVDPEEGGLRLYVPTADGKGVTIAKIARSGVGSSDDRGSYTNARSDEELVALGIPVPPFHGRCRSTIVAGAGE